MSLKSLVGAIFGAAGPKPVDLEYARANEARKKAISEGGWWAVTHMEPPAYEPLQFIRWDWDRLDFDQPFERTWSDFHPEANVADLYWRAVSAMKDVTPRRAALDLEGRGDG